MAKLRKHRIKKATKCPCLMGWVAKTIQIPPVRKTSLEV
jgi:hypothetical protein